MKYKKLLKKAKILAEMRDRAIERLSLSEEHLAWVETEITKLKQLITPLPSPPKQ